MRAMLDRFFILFRLRLLPGEMFGKLQKLIEMAEEHDALAPLWTFVGR